MSVSNEISFDGFQAVSGDYYSVLTRLQASSLTICEGGHIGFCKQNLVLLNVCENTLIQINSEARKIIIVPTASKDKDAVCRLMKPYPPEPRKLASKKLTDKLYAHLVALYVRAVFRLADILKRSDYLYDKSFKTHTYHYPGKRIIPGNLGEHGDKGVSLSGKTDAARTRAAGA